MLRRFFSFNLKIVRLAQIAHTTSYRLPPAIVVSQNSYPRHYATAVCNTEITSKNDLDSMLKELQNRAKYKLRLLDSELKLVLSTIKTQQIDSSHALEILRCCSYAQTDTNQSDSVANIWNELKKRNDLQVEHYNYYLRFATNKRDPKCVQHTFDEMIEADIKPDATSYQCLLSVYCQSANIEKAAEIYRTMKTNNVNVSEGPLNHLVQCHITCGNIDAAKETIADLKKSKYKVNLRTLYALLSYYAKTGDIENIKITFNLFGEENWKLLNRDILSVICELAVNGHSVKIDSLFIHLDTVELRGSLQGAITLYVENKQSQLIPKLLQLAEGDVKLIFKLLMQEMVRLQANDSEFNETIANIEYLGMTNLLLESLFDEDSYQAIQIQKHIQNNGQNQIGSLLKKLMTEQMKLTPGKSTNQENSADKRNQTQVPTETERFHFLTHIREGNITDVDEMLTRGLSFSLKNSDYALLIDLYARLGNLESALKMLKRASGIASFRLKHIQGARIATLMIEKEYDFDDVENLLRAHPQDKAELRIFFVERLFDRLADSGNAELADKFFGVLTKYGYITPSANSAKPIVLAYLKTESLDKAVEKYEYFATTYKFLAITRILYIHLIRHNQHALLQRVYDADKELNGEKTSLGRLASAFSQCGLVDPVHKILKKFNFMYLAGYITRECNQYATFGDIKAAQTLLKATKGLNADRHVIYQSILDICEKQNKADEALNLWQKYYAEYRNLTASDFQQKFVKLLKANNIEIPVELNNRKKAKEN